MIIEAILKINPKAEVSIEDNDINKITWHNGTTPISKSEIEAMIPIVEQEMVQAELDRETKKQEAEAIMEQLGLTKEHLKALGL
jgi:putative methionine-R-sulfoxide reductase with GAF domain